MTVYFAGYYYRKNKCCKDVTYWRCEKLTCFGRLVLSSTYKLIRCSEHNHAGSSARRHILNAANGIQDKAKTTTESPAAIVSAATCTLDRCAQAMLPTKASLTRKARNRMLPKLPATLSAVDIH